MQGAARDCICRLTLPWGFCALKRSVLVGCGVRLGLLLSASPRCLYDLANVMPNKKMRMLAANFSLHALLSQKVLTRIWQVTAFRRACHTACLAMDEPWDIEALKMCINQRSFLHVSSLARRLRAFKKLRPISVISVIYFAKKIGRNRRT